MGATVNPPVVLREGPWMLHNPSLEIVRDVLYPADILSNRETSCFDRVFLPLG